MYTQQFSLQIHLVKILDLSSINIWTLTFRIWLLVRFFFYPKSTILKKYFFCYWQNYKLELYIITSNFFLTKHKIAIFLNEFTILCNIRTKFQIFYSYVKIKFFKHFCNFVLHKNKISKGGDNNDSVNHINYFCMGFAVYFYSLPAEIF